MARPRIKIDEEQVRKLAAINCTMVEIASIMNVSVDTLERRCADIIKSGKAHGRMSLRRKMFEMAMGGNSAIAIFLSKNMLDYSDRYQVHDSEKNVYKEDYLRPDTMKL